MFFGGAMWLIGGVFALEGLRRGLIGGSSLSLFIIKEFGLHGSSLPTLNFLRNYLDIEERIIDTLPDYFQFFVTPWTDHHEAGVTYLKILDILAKYEFPTECDPEGAVCQFYW
ncbi:hypothetical protein ES708_27582 [subsurface metagenome]